jgi:phosphoenolpyruvate---glycerone phosphotransferase subunit DhaL
MTEGLSYQAFSNILERVCFDMKSHKDYLIELDSATGDGDLGITVYHGFEAVEKIIADRPDNVGLLLIKAGMAFNNAVGSTMGALFGMALVRAGKAIGNVEPIDLDVFTQLVRTMEDSIREKGKAQVGDKTMLDAIVPARMSLENSITSHETFKTGLGNAYLAAAEGAEGTKTMQAAFGRSRWLGERTIGFPDPGAVFISLFLKSIWENY